MSGPDAVRRLQQALNGVPGVESVMSVAPFAY